MRGEAEVNGTPVTQEHFLVELAATAEEHFHAHADRDEPQR